MSRRQSSAVDKALRWLEQDPTRTGYAAARKYGLALSTIYRALDRQKRDKAALNEKDSQ